tara:strand:- start:619 stop:1179 length:561 start_codon:yes stop_codon:yes gene_type:complete
MLFVLLLMVGFSWLLVQIVEHLDQQVEMFDRILPVFIGIFLGLSVLFGLVSLFICFRAFSSGDRAVVIGPKGIELPLYGAGFVSWDSILFFEAGLHTDSKHFPWKHLRYPVRVHIDKMLSVIELWRTAPFFVRWVAILHARLVMKLRGYYTFEVSGYWIRETIENHVDDMNRIASAADSRFAIISE